jgi:hypothetical protein
MVDKARVRLLQVYIPGSRAVLVRYAGEPPCLGAIRASRDSPRSGSGAGVVFDHENEEERWRSTRKVPVARTFWRETSFVGRGCFELGSVQKAARDRETPPFIIASDI